MNVRQPAPNTQPSMPESKTFPVSPFAWIMRLWPLLLPLGLLLPGFMDFPYPSNTASFSDISITHYPNAIYLQRALFLEHRLPLWSSQILSGHPFGANPLAGIWYPPGWVTLILPLPLGFNLLVLLHMLWGGFGLYGLMRAEGQAHRPAIFAALMFVALPKMFAHYGAGHLTLLYAVPWTPWLLWAGRLSLTHPSRRRFWQEAVILSLIFLADVRWSLFAGLLWWVYVLAHSSYKKGNNLLTNLTSNVRHPLGQTLLTGLLISPLALPLAQLTLYTSRSQMTAGDVFTYSLPFLKLLGYLFPDFNGFHEWILYVGASGLALSLVMLISRRINKEKGFWLWAVGLSLLFSLGSQIPLLPVLARIPLINLSRVPSRALFITGLSLAALSGYGVQELLDGLSDLSQRRVTRLCTGLLGFVLIFSAAVGLITGDLAINFVWGIIFFMLSGLWILARAHNWVTPAPWFIGLFLICLFDLSGVNHSLFSTKAAAQVLSEGQELAQSLSSRGNLFRIYSPSYSLPQQTAAYYNLELADGVDPLQLQTYVEYMRLATGVPQDGYSVTIPPYSSGNPSVDNADYLPHPELLGLLNVEYIAAQFDLNVSGLELIDQYAETRLYQNDQAYPRAWLQETEDDSLADIKPVKIDSWNSDRIVLQAEGPGLLVLSELAYPGWQVRINGQYRQMETVYGLLRAVRLDEHASQRVEFIFQPRSVYLGVLLCALTIIILVGYTLIIRRKSRIGK